MNTLVKKGYLVVASPIGKNDKSYRRIFILNNLSTIDEAQEVLQSDPAIENQLREPEILPWYGSAALPEYLPFSDLIWKLKP